ncbi:hypothetical protein A2833_01010 [Candidatus Azambacteria bacterium RIFCSPHIGHO2_01_FULL_44_55]|uniref:RecF/RecN/SMC N-terminal domain-containing protein n=1 Tax=Candidatus Azambacteria bacterium RIFCSPLOWO2_02_FULL_44_14 TaxID=1797306 RepID=A0A1F5CAH5_9BACT|nr:MAG: hypothetical protein A3A18_00825 [Candidatus Azambacteria bacterium RIFCSPLOWO2_01_FULL_44_84]OGD33516.1 MAG: hypothetical protein A3C78_00820 [Candidatus Azambacteria bacterium RIFCSPHIGHO2_02_FULL_45_18]OGD39837.1 MAG: hypothetical protein A3I30_00300 [Candidatus Azambacteria bacterium RIFCSPLOWO2_02_FULL_44_14]OGD41798.1 MAG: hypothetical protein A2833_01010 [Candidatus Azambacteria bacterium RIFCSPHIGHO2_01_FULL_44_55]OGD50490.1 MAG: hypothetical protein A2608_01020 [Candidatus Azam
MRLKKLELSGFKSFAQKTTLEFPAGISAIVGPNGSGKSNIVDALRWVLGEQSFKHLRSKAGTDLIWAGSEKKPAQGKAHVALHFDNLDNFFPLDFSEVVIGRKVFKDGANEYYLNESQVRLKDVAELLARSRLGLRGHTIINQGSADSILKASPEDRRGILEEALGLKEFQLKKADAETKLAETRSNLEKARALVTEITPHLRLLRRQAEKFDRREELAASLSDAEDSYFRVILRDLILARSKVLQGKEALLQDVRQKQAIFEEKQKELEEKSKSMPASSEAVSRIEQDLSELSRERLDIQRQLGRLEGLIEAAKKVDPQKAKTLEAVLAVKIRFWSKRLEAALKYADFRQARDIVTNTVKEIKDISRCFDIKSYDKILAMVDIIGDDKKESSPYSEERGRFQSSLAKIEKDDAVLRVKLAELRGSDFAWREDYLATQKNLDMERRAIGQLEESLRGVLFEEEKIKLKEDDVKTKMWAAGKNLDEFIKKYFSSSMAEVEVATTAETAMAPAIDFLELENKIAKLRRELIEIGGIDTAVVQEYGETSKRHEFLISEIADLEKAHGSLKNLIVDLNAKISTDFKIGFAKINEEFNRYFRMMFDGGSARLSEAALEDTDITGIDIHVNVPQKRVRDLNLLSGGERSLVSIAILFAIVAISTPPFLILDEIDAALDESNAQRFAKMLSDLVKSTQFILITHNRATMEAAEVLYGVTMTDDGVSKLFSLKLTDAVETIKGVV